MLDNHHSYVAGGGGGVSTTGFGTYTATAGVETQIDSWSKVSYSGAEYTFMIGLGTYRQSQKVLIMHDGTTAFSQEYGIMFSPEQQVSIAATMSSNNVVVKFTPEQGYLDYPHIDSSRLTLRHMIHTNNVTHDRTGDAVVPTGVNEKKAYSIKCYTKEDWVFIHEELKKDGSLEDNIPDPSIVVTDEKLHSDTRGTYMLTDAEAEDLRKHEKVEFVNIDYAYPGNYSPDPRDVITGVQRFDRFGKSVSNYRAFNTAPSTPPTSQNFGIGASDKNRTGYQILRHTQKENPWDATSTGISGSDHIIIERRIFQLGDGTGVDAVKSDDGFWIAHPEFVTTADDPVGWSTGNVLTWSGISTTPAHLGFWIWFLMHHIILIQTFSITIHLY